MHVFDAAEVTIERSGKDDDRDMRVLAAETVCDFGTELASSQMVVENGDIDVVEELDGLFDSGGGNALIAMLAENGGSEVQIGWFVVE